MGRVGGQGTKPGRYMRKGNPMGKTIERRSVVLGAAAGAALCMAAGTMVGAGGQPGAGPASDLRMTWSNDGRTVYLWSLVGRHMEFVEASRVPAGRAGNAGNEGGDDRSAPDKGDGKDKGDSKDKGAPPGHGRGKGG